MLLQEIHVLNLTKYELGYFLGDYWMPVVDLFTKKFGHPAAESFSFCRSQLLLPAKQGDQIGPIFA
jgi:hypothetical protein